MQVLLVELVALAEDGDGKKAVCVVVFAGKAIKRAGVRWMAGGWRGMTRRSAKAGGSC